MASRTRHSLAQRTSYLASCDVHETPRSSDPPTALERHDPTDSPRPGPATGDSQEPQINHSAIQGFLLSALPLPVLPERAASHTRTGAGERPDARRTRSRRWKPRVISKGEGDTPIPGGSGPVVKAGAVFGKAPDTPEEGSEFENEQGRDPKASDKVSSPLRPLEEQI